MTSQSPGFVNLSNAERMRVSFIPLHHLDQTI